MWKIQVNKINSWFQTTHNKDIYQWKIHKYKSISSWKQETYKAIKVTPPNMNIPTKNMARAKKIKYNVKHLDTI